MDLHQIRYFLALCEELHFTRAAERCAVAQSSLTRAIKALETELGGALFHRERANPHLTQLGERVRPFLAQAYAQVRAASQAAQDAMRVRAMSLQLGLMRSLAPALPVALLAAMQARHPGVALRLTEDGAEALLDQLLAGELDAVICALPAPDPRLDHVPLGREPLVAVVSAAHRLARRGIADIRDLKDDAYLARTHGDALAERFDLTPAFCSGRDDWLLAMAAAGLGYALMPAANAVHPGTVALMLTGCDVAHEIVLATVRGRHAPALATLIDVAMHLRGDARAPAIMPAAHDTAMDRLAPAQ
jgi:LysR family transcriptional regulator, hydrogen peroxide-inducible genes activator